MSEPLSLTSRRLRSQFERALRAASSGRIQLRLYVSGLTPKSTCAISDLERLCRERLTGRRCDVEIIDIYQQPERAVEAQIVAVPTLIKIEPAPVMRSIGKLTEGDRVLKNLGLAA